jgi:type IV pilus assembly protein PilX
MSTPSPRPSGASPQAQRGVVLFIALIVLVAMTLAGIALSRSVGTGILVAGNLAFQEGATSSADGGIEAGRAWLVAQDADTLRVDQARGYFANWDTTFDPSTFNWTGLATTVGTDAAGNTIEYVVHRLCRNSNETANAPGQQCVSLTSAGASSSKGGTSYGSTPLTGTLQVYYRVTARVTGPRNTVSYVQSVMY